MSNDAYIRLGSGGPRDYGQPQAHESVLFVDAAPGQSLAGLRNADVGLFRDTSIVILRADHPCDSPEAPVAEESRRFVELSEQVSRLRLETEFGVLHQPVGSSPWIEGEVSDRDECVERARAIELEALLDWGSAIWKPETYHYRLPSGEHAAGFVRMADAVRRPRDAEVLASWMHAHLHDEVGIVLDTGTLSSIVQALVGAMRSKGWRPGLINVLDGYPTTNIDVSRAVREAGRQSGVLALLSVNSSGRVLDRLVDALGAVGADKSRSVNVMVNKRPIQAHGAEHANGAVIQTWHPRPGQRPLIEYGVERAETCELCRNAATATLIPVDPISFDGRIPASVHRIVPNVADAHANRRLWELTSPTNGRQGAIALDAKPLDDDARPRGAMAFVFDRAQLVAQEDFRNAAAREIRRLMRQRREEPIGADLLLVPEHENGLEGIDELVSALAACFGEPPRAPFPRRGEWPDDLIEQVRQARDSIAVLTLGSVSGTTLQNALSAIQGARLPGPYDLTAFVLHARPSELRGWRTLENSYSHRLFYAWQSYLPDRSPLQDERLTLDGLLPSDVAALSPNAIKFLKNRRRFLRSVEVELPKVGLLWGTQPTTLVTPNSIFGQGLRCPAVYTAVAAAMERSRKESRATAAPARRVFEMPAIARSYYDPLILGSVLRWLQPHEAWWGNQLGDEATTVHAMIARATPPQRPVLVAELLLASAQGKINAPGARVVRSFADDLLASGDLSAIERGPIEVGARLVAPQETEDKARLRKSAIRELIDQSDDSKQLLTLVPQILRDLRQGRLPEDIAARLAERVDSLIHNPDAAEM